MCSVVTGGADWARDLNERRLPLASTARSGVTVLHRSSARLDPAKLHLQGQLRYRLGQQHLAFGFASRLRSL